MKKSLFTILVSILWMKSGVQMPFDCNAPAAFATAYNGDVRDMAVGGLYAAHHPDTALISIPQIHLDTIMGGLAALYNLNGALATDIPLNKYCIHNAGRRATSRLSVVMGIDRAETWLQQLLNYLPVSANTAAADLFGRYNINLKSAGPHSWGSSATVAVDSGVNVYALRDSLATLAGIYTPYVSSVPGDGSFLQYSQDSARHYRLALLWDDCPAGVLANPNPAADRWFISSAQPQKYLLTDAVGRRCSGGCFIGRHTIEALALPSGLYFLTTPKA